MPPHDAIPQAPVSAGLTAEEESSLIAFLAQNVDLHNEVVYDSSDSYCHLAVRYDAGVGFRRIVSGPRDYVIYSQHEITGREALELVAPMMLEAGWTFPQQKA